MIKSKIIPKINNFINDLSLYKSFDEIFNYNVKLNILSVDIHDIINGRKNKRKFIISSLNCAFMIFVLLMIIPFILSDKLTNLFANPIIPIDKQFIGLMFFALLSMASLRIAFLKDEKQSNLIWLKFMYYLMTNDQLNHKLNNHNYKMMTITSQILYFTFIQIGHPLIFCLVFLFVVLSIISKSLVLIMISLPLFYAFFTNLTSHCGLAPLIVNLLVYYIIRFKQINTQMRIYSRIKRIPFQSINRLLNEHNQLSLSIHQLNLIMNKLMACTGRFISSCHF